MEKKVTIYDIAEECGVSVSAVSRAFNPNSKLSDDKRERILAVSKKLDYVPNRLASRLSKKTVRIGVVFFEYYSIYESRILDGIRAAYEPLRDFKVELDIRVLKYGEDTLDDALAIMEAFGDSGFDGIIINSMPDDYIPNLSNVFFSEESEKRIKETATLRRLSERGVRIVTLDTDIPDCGRLFFSAIDPERTGRMVTELLNGFIKVPEKNIAVFTSGKYGLLDAFCRTAIADGMRIVDTVFLEIDETEEDYRKNAEAVQRTFEEHPEITGVYVVSANCISICNYLWQHDPEHRITLIASDIFDEMRPYFDEGVINASIYDNSYYQGKEAIETLYACIAEGGAAKDTLLTAPQIILRSNMDLF